MKKSKKKKVLLKLLSNDICKDGLTDILGISEKDYNDLVKTKEFKKLVMLKIRKGQSSANIIQDLGLDEETYMKLLEKNIKGIKQYASMKTDEDGEEFNTDYIGLSYGEFRDMVAKSERRKRIYIATASIGVIGLAVYRTKKFTELMSYIKGRF